MAKPKRLLLVSTALVLTSFMKTGIYTDRFSRNSMTFQLKSTHLVANAIFCLAFALISSTLQQNLVGQNLILQIDGTKQQMYQQFMNLFEQQKEQSEHRIQTQLNDIINACNLTAVQKTKLSIASKGAVNEHAKRITIQLKKTATSIAQFEFDPGNPPEHEEGEDQDDGLLPIRGGRVRVVSIQSESEGFVENAIVWTNTIEKTLSEEQIERLNQWILDREQRVRKSAVAGYVAQIDMKMYLSPAQLTKVSGWIDDRIGHNLVSQMQTNQRRQAAIFVGNRIGGPMNIQINPRLAELLTKPQQEIWKTEFQQDFDRIQKIKRVGAIKFHPAASGEESDKNNDGEHGKQTEKPIAPQPCPRFFLAFERQFKQIPIYLAHSLEPLMWT